MLLEYPIFYPDFACIGKACKDSCCRDWVIDIDEDTCVVKIIDEIDSNILPSLRENCFYLRFNNTDLDTPSFIIMAENIVISYEKKYFNQL